MPTTVTHTYGAPGFGRDYTSLITWDADNGRDLVAVDEIEVLECYKDGQAYYEDNANMGSYWHTDTDHYIQIKAAAGEEHNGTFNTGVQFRQSTTASAIFNLIPDGALKIGAYNLYFEGLELLSDTSSVFDAAIKGKELDVSTAKVVAINCLFGIARAGDYGKGLRFYQENNTKAVNALWLINCRFSQLYRGIEVISDAGFPSTVHVESCSFWTCSYGSYLSSATLYAYNNATFHDDQWRGSRYAFLGGTHIGDYNVSDCPLDDRLRYPTGIATNNNGTVWVGDSSNNRTMRKDASSLLHQAKTHYDYDSSPSGIAYFDGLLYVAARLDGKVKKRDAYGEWMTASDATTYTMDYPFGVCVDGAYVFVTAWNDDKIVKIDIASLDYIDHYWLEGTNNRSLSSPAGIAYDNDYLYVCDKYNNRIIRMQKNLSASWDLIDDVISGLYAPEGVACDDTYLYVVDTGNHRILKYDKSALTLVDLTGNLGSGVGEFNEPSNVAYDETYLYITDKNNSRIVKLLKSNLSWVGARGYYATVTDDTAPSHLPPGSDSITQSPTPGNNYADVSAVGNPDMDIKDTNAELFRAGTERATQIAAAYPWYTNTDIHGDSRMTDSAWDVGSDQLVGVEHSYTSFSIDLHLLPVPMTTSYNIDAIVQAPVEEEFGIITRVREDNINWTYTTVGTGGEYTTFASWESDRQRDLEAANEIEICVPIGAGTAETVTISGWWTTEDNYIKITTLNDYIPGNYHYGIAGNGFVLSGNMDIYVANVWVDGIEIDYLGTHGIDLDIYPFQSNPGWWTRITNNIIHSVSRSGTGFYISDLPDYPKAYGIYVCSNVVYDCSIGIHLSFAYNPGVPDQKGANYQVYNNSVFNCNYGIQTVLSNYITARNNACLGNSYDFDGPFESLFASNNASTDSSAPGDNSLTGVIAAGQWISTTTLSENLHLRHTSQLRGAGTVLIDSYATYDIDDENRMHLWDIGADQFYPKVHELELTCSTYVVPIERTQEFNIDTIVSGRIEQGITTDTTIVLVMEPPFSIDALLPDRKTSAFTMDAWIKGFVLNTLDASVVDRIERLLSCDAIVQQTIEDNLTISVSVRELYKLLLSSIDVHVSAREGLTTIFGIDAIIDHAYEAHTLYIDDDYDDAYSTGHSLGNPVGKKLRYAAQYERGTQDIQIFYRNESGFNLQDVTVQPVEQYDDQKGEQSTWWKLAKAQAALEDVQWGAALTLGDFDIYHTTSFWARIAVPDGQSAGAYTDVVLRIAAVAFGLPPKGHPFTIDVIVNG